MPEVDPVALTRGKVEPMVRGLFPRAEQDVALATLEKSVAFLTSTNIEPLLLERGFDSSAWTLANLYLASVGAELLGADAPRIVGLSEETVCYVSPAYFAQDDPFADFIVHEAAHIFHNCKRATVGLRETRTKEWLLDIELPEARDLRVLVRGLCVRARARQGPDRATVASRGIRQHRTHLRGARGGLGGREHRRGGSRRSERLESHPRAVRSDEPSALGPATAEGRLGHSGRRPRALTGTVARSAAVGAGLLWSACGSR
jgi:hypothetical protein